MKYIFLTFSIAIITGNLANASYLTGRWCNSDDLVVEEEDSGKTLCEKGTVGFSFYQTSTSLEWTGTETRCSANIQFYMYKLKTQEGKIYLGDKQVGKIDDAEISFELNPSAKYRIIKYSSETIYYSQQFSDPDGSITNLVSGNFSQKSCPEWRQFQQ